MSIVATPTIPIQAAGEIAASADMNALAGAAQFLLNKPITIIPGSGTVFAAALSFAQFAYTSANKIVDTDGLVSGSPTGNSLTVQRYGMHWAELSVTVTLTAGTEINVWIGVYAGPNNPFVASGSQVFLSNRFFIVPGSGVAYVQLGGLIPVPCFPGDSIDGFIENVTGTAGTGTWTGTETVRWVGLP